MSNKTKSLIVLVIAAGGVAIAAYLLSPVGTGGPGQNTGKPQSQTPQTRQITPEQARTEVSSAPTQSAAVDASIEALLLSLDQEEQIAATEDAETAFAQEDLNAINSLGETYNENQF